MSHFRPYVSRTTKAINWIKATAKWAWQETPQETAGYVIVIPFIIYGVCKVYRMNGSLFELPQPYYRYRYEVRRPDDPIVLNWRPPSDYPAPYITNRETKDYRDYLKDYGFTSKID